MAQWTCPHLPHLNRHRLNPCHPLPLQSPSEPLWAALRVLRVSTGSAYLGKARQEPSSQPLMHPFPAPAAVVAALAFLALRPGKGWLRRRAGCAIDDGGEAAGGAKLDSLLTPDTFVPPTNDGSAVPAAAPAATAAIGVDSANPRSFATAGVVGSELPQGPHALLLSYATSGDVLTSKSARHVQRVSAGCMVASMHVACTAP